ncbi:TetR/AcrR family transcriptional regulator [Kitasatospora sp. NPDC058115]|uniref:TetR/AcrR family transcriptional regulator n=1 Tax=Kitasatospora sp. NPDC058115 TaxID=3346347 RepID=UPI0036DF6F8A
MTKPRGPYAKTSSKRQQIIEAALAAYAEAGSRKVSVRDIAQRVGMTDAGVLHHFGGREALFTAVLAARDAASEERFGAFEERGADDFLRILADNAATPGLVKLFVDLAAAAAEPDHPAHDYFGRRYEGLRRRLADRLVEQAATRSDTAGPDSAGPGTAAPDTARPDAERADEAAWAARILIAATDGLQLQWLLDPRIDMADDIGRLARVLLDAPAERQRPVS